MEANARDLFLSTAIGGLAGKIGGDGVNGKNMYGVYRYSKQVINTTKSARKQAMYIAKIMVLKRNLIKSSFKMAVAGLFSNGGNWARKFFLKSKV